MVKRTPSPADNGRYRLEDLLSIEEAAELLGLPIKSLRDYIYRRIVPFTKIGRHVRFSRTVLEAWLAELEVAPIRKRPDRGRRPRNREENQAESEVTDGEEEHD